MTRTAEAEPKAFSASELRLMTAFFSNMKSKPDVDWDLVAQDATLKDARCARDRFRQIMAKHDIGGGASPAPSPRKGKQAGNGGGGGEGGVKAAIPLKAAPAKVAKKKAPRKKVVKKKKKVVSDDDAEYEEKKDEDMKVEMKDEKGIDDDTT